MIAPLILALLLHAGQVPAGGAAQTEQAAPNPTPTQAISACKGSIISVYPGTYSPEYWGSSLERFDIVFVGEGFTDSPEDVSLYEQKVGEAIDSLSSGPFERCAFNFYSVRLISKESGSDHPLNCPPTYKDTPLHSEFGDPTPGSEYCDDRFLLVDTLAAQTAASCATDDYDQVVVLVNDPAYGGMYFKHEQIVTVSIGQGFENVIVHEMGHAFAALGDEYGADPYNLNWIIDEPNLTAVTKFPDLTNWSVAAEVETLGVPTDLSKLKNSPAFSGWKECELKETLGMWQGGGGFGNGVYRPEFTCMMRDARKHFCKVCSNVIAKIAKAYCASRSTLFMPAPGVTLKCMAGLLVRIPLPPCLKCLTAVGSTEIAGVDLSQRDVARVDIGPLPGVLEVKVTTVGPGGQTILVDKAETPLAAPSSTNAPGPTFSLTFDIQPDAKYYIEFSPATCTESDFDFSIHLFVNDEEVGVL